MKYLPLVILGSLWPLCCYTSDVPPELCVKLPQELKKMENSCYSFEVSFPWSDFHAGQCLALLPDGTSEGAAWEREHEKDEGLL